MWDEMNEPPAKRISKAVTMPLSRQSHGKYHTCIRWLGNLFSDERFGFAARSGATHPEAWQRI